MIRDQLNDPKSALNSFEKLLEATNDDINMMMDSMGHKTAASSNESALAIYNACKGRAEKDLNIQKRFEALTLPYRLADPQQRNITFSRTIESLAIEE
jgi:hypothetical protein